MKCVKVFFANLLICSTLLLPVSVSAETDFVLMDIKEIKQNNQNIAIEQLLSQLPKTATLDNPYLQLVNHDNLLQSEPEIPFVYSDSGLPHHEVLETPLYEMRQAAAVEGYYYSIVSAYRSIDEQSYNRQNAYEGYLYAGYSEADAQHLTNLYYAASEGSEHSIGLAVDIVDSSWLEGLTPDMQYLASMQWLAANAHKYGFVLRFLDGKQDITHINFEPWHFRYVGVEHATFMYEHGLVLEEYMALIAERDKQLAASSASE